MFSFTQSSKAIATALALLLSSAAALALTFTEFEAPGTTGDGSVIRADNGYLYFIHGNNRIARITPAGRMNSKSVISPSAAGIGAITADITDNLWLTDTAAGSLGSIKLHAFTPGVRGSLHEHTLPKGTRPRGVVAGLDGNLWVSDRERNAIFYVQSEFFVEHKIPTAQAGIAEMTIDGDGNLWFTEQDGGKIGRLIPGGFITEFALSGAASRPTGITLGPDDNIWFTDPGKNTIGRIDPTTTAIAEFAIPSAPGGEPHHLTAGSDGNLWYTATRANKLGKVTPEGAITEFDLPEGLRAPGAITAGHDGNLWFLANDKVATVADRGFKTPMPEPAVFSFAVSRHTAFEYMHSTTITIKRSGNLALPASVHYSVHDESAVKGKQYLAESGLLFFAPDEISKTVAVEILEDNLAHGLTTFRVKLSEPSLNALIGPTEESTVTIIDTSAPPELKSWPEDTQFYDPTIL
jgi:virginiamycin B lyase